MFVVNACINGGNVLVWQSIVSQRKTLCRSTWSCVVRTVGGGTLCGSQTLSNVWPFVLRAWELLWEKSGGDPVNWKCDIFQSALEAPQIVALKSCIRFCSRIYDASTKRERSVFLHCVKTHTLFKEQLGSQKCIVWITSPVDARGGLCFEFQWQSTE